MSRICYTGAKERVKGDAFSSVYGMRDEVQQAFSQAYERYSDELFRHCALRLSDRERALEITQEAFLRTWKYLSGGQEIEELRPFLYRTLKNLIIDEYRKMKTYSLEAMVNEEEGQTVESFLPSDDSNTLEAAVGRFEGKRAIEMLARLPDSYKEVLLLRYVDGFSPKEIAGELSESENTVSVRLHRALKKLRDLLEADGTKS